jgi:hypothetical protein
LSGNQSTWSWYEGMTPCQWCYACAHKTRTLTTLPHVSSYYTFYYQASSETTKKLNIWQNIITLYYKCSLNAG